MYLQQRSEVQVVLPQQATPQDRSFRNNGGKSREPTARQTLTIYQAWARGFGWVITNGKLFKLRMFDG